MESVDPSEWSVLRDAKGNPYASGRLDELYAYGGFEKKSRLLRLK